MSLAAQQPELFYPERYYTAADQLDWAGRDTDAYAPPAPRLFVDSPAPTATPLAAHSPAAAS
ncbi:hypothetical protein P5V34_04765 [Mycobacteroides abscessus subsp. abscessus]|uniref:hypothetical protein n=1 Tax=Mycobacteroides abscessus TaxID=36809 RepID=UPI00266C6852|nr:hypothetical protein [Mycobacteroides abscessus]MDO3013299.1 hypothetical protein [Mycobacteroides abscessus subsp. abscessus]